MYFLDGNDQYLMFNVLGFLVGALFFGGLMTWLSTGLSSSQKRLKALEKGNRRGQTYVESGFTVRWAEPIAKMIVPQEDWRKSRMKSRLVTAGFRSPEAQTYYLASKVLLAFIPALLFVFPLALTGYVSLSQAEIVTLIAATAIFCFFVPDIYLLHHRKKRQTMLEESFPDALDLLVVCVEAGLSLDAAIQRVSKELYLSHPELGNEIGLVSLELRAGKSRTEALHSLSRRTGLDDVKALVSILVQAEHFGTSIASALREHADEMRVIRIQRAKEKAAKLPVKLTIPILLFIFPSIFLVVIGPAVISIFINFISA
ncbi:MAG: type II secretion system F family protein [Sinobacterium sp.]|nr:type II secretion system F family protein [Sinobacterium sp.]